MADEAIVHIGENSPEQVAYKLLGLIGNAERKSLNTSSSEADRKWILDTYAECLDAARGKRGPTSFTINVGEE